VGIAPHVSVDSALALDTAHRLALGGLLADADPGRRLELDWALQGLLGRREDRDPLPLIPLTRDLFRVGDSSYLRLRFERNDRGEIVRLVGVYNDGREETNEKESASRR